ncbi:MAG: phosphoribosylanthranilate isomerase [Planctomycetota bacterium]
MPSGPLSFTIKICGVRTPEDIDFCSDAGVDCVGLNFFPPSVRCIDVADAQTAALVKRSIEHGLKRVGVFVNADLPTLRDIRQRCQLDAVQLHGDETPEFAADLLQNEISVVRAIRLPAGPLTIERIQMAITPWRDLGVRLLFDADAGSQYGGSGQRLDVTTIGQWAGSLEASSVAWSLAGGLKPENVEAAVRDSHASSVDVASGVEAPKGTKSPELIRQFASSAAVAIRKNQAESPG